MAEEGKTLSTLPELVPPAAFMEDVKAYMEGGGAGAGGLPSRLGLLGARAADLRRRLTAAPRRLPPRSLRPLLLRRQEHGGSADGAACQPPEVQVH